jgi:hypothetical protein
VSGKTTGVLESGVALRILHKTPLRPPAGRSVERRIAEESAGENPIAKSTQVLRSRTRQSQAA